MSMASLIVTAALLIAVLFASLARTGGRRRTAGVASVWPTGVAAVIAAAGLSHEVLTRGDIAGASLTVLVAVLTLVVQVFADRHLRGDPRARAFFALSALVAAGSTVAVSADGVVLLAGGWTVATAGTIGLIGTGGRGPQTRAAVRRAALALGVGDAALWLAVAITITTIGSGELADLENLRGAPAVAVGVLVAVTAIARAGSFPLHTWLAATAATTTPASALLHAGFVNAGALLLLRFAEVPSVIGPWIVGVAGGITLLAAAVAMRTRPDVKGRLVQSTAAQMGFMLLACGIGAFGVALVHVLGHALFKASLFLGAGSAVERAIALRSAPTAPRSRGGSAAAAGAVIAAGAAVILLGGAVAHTSAVLLLFVVATAALAGARLGGATSPLGIRALLVALVAGAVVGYVLVVARGAEALAPVEPAAALSPLFALAVFVVASVLALVSFTSGRAADAVFAFAFAWGRSPLPAPARTSDVTTPPTAARGPLEYGRLS